MPVATFPLGRFIHQGEQLIFYASKEACLVTLTVLEASNDEEAT